MPHFCNVVLQIGLREGISRLCEQVRDWLVSPLPLRVRFSGLQTDRLLRYPIACLICLTSRHQGLSFSVRSLLSLLLLDFGDSCFQGGVALALAFAAGPSVGPDFLYFDGSDVTTSSVDDFDEH